MSDYPPIPSDPREAAIFICARIDTLSEMYAKTLNEIADMQATVNVVLACLKTIMAVQGVSLRLEPTPSAERAWAMIEADCNDAHTLYHTEALKRIQSFDESLFVEPEKPNSEH